MSTDEPVPKDPQPAEAAPTEPTGPTARPTSPEPPPEPARAPDAETLERIAEPVVVRRAPRFAAFIRTGVVLGIVVGLLVSATPRSAPDENRTFAIALTVLGLALLGALIGAATAVVADRRSDRGD